MGYTVVWFKHELLVGQDIAAPLVDLASVTKATKARVRALDTIRAAKAAIVEKHCLRLVRRPPSRSQTASVSLQQSLDF